MKFNKSKTTTRSFQKLLAIILLFVVINQLAACSYYSVESITWENSGQTKDKMLDYKANNKYFILDCGKDSYHITDMAIDSASMTIQCCIAPVDSLQHHLYNPGIVTNKKYKPGQFEGDPEGEQTVLNEIHIVANKPISYADSSAIIPINSIVRIDIINPNRGKTTATYFVGIIGGVVILPISIFALTFKNSFHPFSGSSGYSFHI